MTAVQPKGLISIKGTNISKTPPDNISAQLPAPIQTEQQPRSIVKLGGMSTAPQVVAQPPEESKLIIGAPALTTTV